MALTSGAAVASPMAGVWQFNLVNIIAPPAGYAQLVVEFSHSAGDKDYAKVAVRGVMDDITRTLQLVQASL